MLEQDTRISPNWLRVEPLIPPAGIKNVVDLALSLYNGEKWEKTRLSMRRMLLIPMEDQRLIGMGWNETGQQFVVQTWKMSQNENKTSFVPEQAIARRTSMYDYPYRPRYFRTDGVDASWLEEVAVALKEISAKS